MAATYQFCEVGIAAGTSSQKSASGAFYLTGPTSLFDNVKKLYVLGKYVNYVIKKSNSVIFHQEITQTFNVYK